MSEAPLMRFDGDIVKEGKNEKCKYDNLGSGICVCT